MDANKNGKAASIKRYTASAFAKRLRKAKPPANPEAIPTELRERRQWVTWDYCDYGEGKPRKVPMQPGKDWPMRGWNTSTNWRTFDEVMREACDQPGLGVGFVFDEGDGFVGVDQDDAYDDDGRLKPWAREICTRYQHTYGERTPSGQGVHHIGYGDRVNGKTRIQVVDGAGAVERYSQDRWFTFTGDVISDKPVCDVRASMAWLADTFFGGDRPAAEPATVRPASDDPEMDTTLAQVCIELLSDNRACDSEEWRRVGYALKGTSESLYPLWLGFSKRWPDCDDDECADRWRRFHSRSTVGTLVQMAVEDSGRTAIQLRDEARARLGRKPWKPSRIEAVEVSATTIDEIHDGAADLTRPHTLDDTGAARRLAKMIRGELIYNRERKEWMRYDGQRWIDKAEHIAVQRAKKMHDEFWNELAACVGERQPRTVKFVQSSGTHAKLTAAVALARDEPGINVSQEEFDAHSWLLNVRNGVLDLRSGELLPHDPALRMTQLADVTYDPDARSELWERFIVSVSSGDDEKAEFLQQVFGLALTGDVSDEVLVCHNGGGCNGKSTALEAVGRMLGDYAAVAPPGMFAARKFDAHPTEIAGLRGKRFVTAVEQEANRALRESLIKQLTGGDTIRTRGMREDFWEMRPTWHIHMAYNVAPRLTGTDDGIRRRLIVVPWNASFKGDPDPTIKERLTSEGERAGILNWCLDGLRKRLLAGRLVVPEACRLKTDEYLDDEDVIGRFLSERTEADDTAVLELREMLRAFRAWMEADGVQRYVIDQFTANALGRELARRGYRKMRPDSGIHRKQTVIAGLRLVESADDLHVYADNAWQNFDR
jgi:putative DNA primase/helicase